MKILKYSGLRFRIIAGVLLIATIPLIAVAIISLDQFKRTLKIVAADDLQEKTYLVGGAIEQFLEQRIAYTGTLAQADIFRGTDAVIMSEYLTDVVRSNRYYSGIYLLDLSNNIIVSTSGDGSASTEFVLRREVRAQFETAKVARKGNVFVSDLMKKDGQAVVLLTAPVMSADGAQVEKVLSMELNTRPIEDQVADFDNRVVGGKHVYILDEVGNVLVTVDENAHTFEKFIDVGARPEILQDFVAANANGTRDYVDAHGDEVMIGYKDISEFGTNKALKWTLVAVAPSKEILAPAIALQSILLAIISVVIFVIVGIGYIFSGLLTDFILTPIRKAVTQLLGVGRLLSSSTHQSSESTGQNASTARSLAVGANEQSIKAGGISESVTDMAAAIQQMSAAALAASSSALKTTQMAQETGESSERIGRIVEAITKIAEQTNLLALNAAIEAARAGESGRGFAVVADEVRKLSESSNQSAIEISIVLKEMVDKVLEIVRATSEVSQKIQEVSVGIEQQSGATQKISLTMDAIATVSEENAASAEELAVAAEKQRVANQHVAASALLLTGLAVDLRELTGAQLESEVVDDPVPENDMTPQPEAPQVIERRKRTGARRVSKGYGKKIE